MVYKKYNLNNYVNIKSMCNKAMKGKYAIPQFNINNLEWTKAILEVAQEMKSPVILGASYGAIKYMGGLDTIVGLVTGLIKDINITIPVALHLDHATDVETCLNAIKAGFSSVMYDGSSLDIEENVKNTKTVVNFASKYDVSVEGEVGIVGGAEDNVVNEGVIYAKLSDVIKLKDAGVDVLAASYGSVHGVYHQKPNIGFSEIKKASEETRLPLVLHGGSGLSNDIIKKAISCGESKINVNTENQIGYAKMQRNYFQEGLDNADKGFDPRKVIGYAIEKGMKPVLREKILLFGSKDKA